MKEVQNVQNTFKLIGNTKLWPGAAELIPYNCNGYFEVISLDTPGGFDECSTYNHQEQEYYTSCPGTFKITVSYLKGIFCFLPQMCFVFFFPH